MGYGKCVGKATDASSVQARDIGALLVAGAWKSLIPFIGIGCPIAGRGLSDSSHLIHAAVEDPDPRQHLSRPWHERFWRFVSSHFASFTYSWVHLAVWSRFLRYSVQAPLPSVLYSLIAFVSDRLAYRHTYRRIRDVNAIWRRAKLAA